MFYFRFDDGSRDMRDFKTLAEVFKEAFTFLCDFDFECTAVNDEGIHYKDVNGEHRTIQIVKH